MAKRKALRINKQEAIACGNNRYTAARLIHPTATTIQRGVAKAQAKHRDDNAIRGPKPLSLGHRFQALPAELRAHIFSLLLVRPVKWNLDHEPDCPLYADPTLDLRAEPGDCARCWGGLHPLLWRNQTTRRGGWKGARLNPWRSKYAPTVMNDFMCSDCWDESFREQVTALQFPKVRSAMPCLCAQRRHLDVLLVCRQWYAEASNVLWTGNTITFETCELFTAFATTCTARDKIGKISIINTGRHDPPASVGTFERPDWAFHKKRQTLIAALRSFPALRHLELDSCLLRDGREVQAMLRLGMRDLRSISFIYHPPTKKTLIPTVRLKEETRKIYPDLQKCVLLRGGLAEEVARAIMGEHRGWTKQRIIAHGISKPNKTGESRRTGVSLLEIAVKNHIVIENSLESSLVATHRIVNCDEADFAEQLWWKNKGRLHWSQSYFVAGSEHYDSLRRTTTVKERRVENPDDSQS